jgi:cyclophilin family peptidyl-prolyl cis-trans isomerase
MSSHQRPFRAALSVIVLRITDSACRLRASVGVRCHFGRSCAAVWLLLASIAATSLGNAFVRLDYNLTLNSRSRDTVFLELFDDRALTRDNFLQYVNGNNYNGTIMHRLAQNFVIQGGGFYPFILNEPAPLNFSLDPDAEVDLDHNPLTPNPTIMNEYGNVPTRSNMRGTIAMARRGGQPDSADSQWFVNLGNNTGLDSVDGGFTVFGRVLGDGMGLFDAFNTLIIKNLNPDYDNNGTRDAGPFYLNSTDGTPVLERTGGGDLLVTLENAQQIDYLGAGLVTDVPAGGLTFASRNAFIDTGTTFTGTGPLTIGAERTLGIREGFTLARPLVNRGTLAPGLQLGSVTVQTYQQFFDGTLDIQLRETMPDTEHDRLVVSETAFLAGRLDISLLSGFVPAAGDSFTVLTAESIVGNFAEFDLPQLSPGLVWDIVRSTTAVTLSAVRADFNHNGLVDAADFALWRNARNAKVTPFTGADGNGDGTVNDLDLAIWRSNFGNTAGTSTGTSGTLAAAVPEPSSPTLMAAIGLLFATARRARRRPFFT